MWSALIGGAFGLFGAAQQRRDDLHDNEVAYARQKADQASYFEDTRAAAERGGYNPLAALGMLPQVQAQKPAASTIGAAVSDAGLLMADALAKRPDPDLQAEQIRLRNEQLTKTVRKLTLQPDVAGWLGGGNAKADNSSNSILAHSSALPPLSGGRLSDDRRELSVKPQENFSGSRVITVGRHEITVPTDGDEVLGPLNTAWIAALHGFQNGPSEFRQARLELNSNMEKARKSRERMRAETYARQSKAMLSFQEAYP